MTKYTFKLSRKNKAKTDHIECSGLSDRSACDALMVVLRISPELLAWDVDSYAKQAGDRSGKDSAT